METELKKNLITAWEKKGLSKTSINLYTKNLEKLNDNKPLKNFVFLAKPNLIFEKLNKYKDTTKRNYIISICSALKMMDMGKKVYETYYNELKKKNTELNSEEKKNEKSEKQKENWLSWGEIQEKQNDLLLEVNKIKNKKKLTESEYNNLLSAVILSLYIDNPPRRNKDYNMYIVKKTPEDGKENYLNVSTKEFIFNNYKTSKVYEKVKIPIPANLWNLIKIYMKFHKNKNGDEIPFLVNYDGESLNKINSITNILNKVFNKKIGSNMLRHIYLSDKYGDINKEKEKDAKEMAHSVDMQNLYVKN